MSNNALPLEKKKIVVIGDGACGKTCLLMVYVENQFPIEYIPTVFDDRLKDIDLDGISVPLLLMDTSGQEDYERLRALQYIDTDVFVLCFAVDNRTSYANIRGKWIKEIKSLKLPIVLVGTKSDLRNESSEDVVMESEGKSLAKKIKAFSYFECSAKLCDGVSEVFEAAARASFQPKTSRYKCTII